MMAYLKNFMDLFAMTRKFFHKFIKTSENKRQPKYMTKTSCHKTLEKKTETQDT